MGSLCNSIALVLPRYGRSLGGGAETLAQSLIHALVNDVNHHVERVEVWTTCAKDHRTWANELPAGTSVEDGITVRRFPVDSRDLEVFLQAEFAMRDGRTLTTDEQLEWLANSVNSSDLYRHIERHGEEFSTIIFAPYLFATTFWGSLIYPDRSLIIPCLHDEHYAYQPVFKALFSKVRGLIFNASAERELARRLYGSAIAEKGGVVGMGFVAPELKESRQHAFATVSERYNLKHQYLLYSGRKEQGKNLDLLIRYFEEGRTNGLNNDLDLLLIGAGEINFLDRLPEGIRDLGFVSEAEKVHLMRGALALVQPSVNESFSIVMMEAFLNETPALVHAHSPVTRGHVVESGGGMFFADAREFGAIVAFLKDNPNLRDAMGRSAREYVVSDYNWGAVIERLYRAFERVDLGSAVRADVLSDARSNG